MSLSDSDREILADAVRRLERPSLAARLADYAGRPVGFLGRALPRGASALVTRAATRALDRALAMALFSLGDARFIGGRALHSALASASGAVGGAFGLASVMIELPVSTTIMLRAIAAIARAEGEDLADPATGIACLEVFALGGPAVFRAAETGPIDFDTPESMAQSESGYFAVRGLLARALGEAADVVVGKSVLREGAPLMARFVAQIASRFGLVVSEKVAAQAVPIVGALGGAAVNLAFAEHFQEVARGHFAVRRLERLYGAEIVRAEYGRLRDERAEQAA
jgi:hypothetical protein